MLELTESQAEKRTQQRRPNPAKSRAMACRGLRVQAGCICMAVCWLGMLSELLQHKRSSAPGGVTQTASVGGKMAREQNW